MIESLALVFSLVLGVLQIDHNTLLCPLLGYQLGCKLLVLLLGRAQGPSSINAEIGLNPSFISRVPNPFLNHGDLLDSLHIGNKRVCLKKKSFKKGGNHY